MKPQSSALLAAMILGLPAQALAAPMPAAASDDLLGKPLSLVVALALLSLLPFVFMTTTAFVKIATTLQIVRSAIGAQGVPSNTVLTALAVALSLLAMAPVGASIGDRLTPVLEAKSTDTMTQLGEIADAVREPMRSFLRANASSRERERFLRVAQRAREGMAEQASENDLVVLAPAFVTTELYEAFALGFLIYLPFLVIDLVVANVLLAMGMSQLTPSQVSLPFKLLLFVAVDGWGVLAQSLVSGYRAGLVWTAL